MDCILRLPVAFAIRLLESDHIKGLAFHPQTVGVTPETDGFIEAFLLRHEHKHALRDEAEVLVVG
jgi:hypothetical protein